MGMSEEAFGRHSTGEVATYRERLRRKAPFPDCGVEMTAGSITYHIHRINGTEPEIDWDRILVSQHNHIHQVYGVRLPKDTDNYKSSFQGCPWSSLTISGLWKKFNRMHWRESIQILEEHPTLCLHCEM